MENTIFVVCTSIGSDVWTARDTEAGGRADFLFRESFASLNNTVTNDYESKAQSPSPRNHLSFEQLEVGSEDVKKYL